MTASDIDDKLGPAGELKKLRQQYFGLDQYLKEMMIRPITRARVLFGAGISEDGKTPYIDERINTDLDGVDVSRPLAIHEQVEWAVRKFCKIGVDYAKDPTGHRLANRAEYECVAKLFPKLSRQAAWKKYDDFIDPQIKAIESKPLIVTPANLALYPYQGDKDAMKKIREAQE